MFDGARSGATRGTAGADTTETDGATSSRRALLDRVAALSDEDLAATSVHIAATLSAAQAELAAVLREIERRDLHGAWDCPSIERFAGWKCQVGAARAAALGTLGRAIEQLPALGEAVVRGELAIDKAVSIARVASADSVDALVDLARHATVEQTRRFCAKWRRVDGSTGGDQPAGEDDTARAADDTALGRVVIIHDDDGVELRARFDHVHGALVLTALDAVTAQVRAERTRAVPADASSERTAAAPGPRPASVDEIPLERLDRAQWRAQGLLRLCETASSTTPASIHRSGFSSEVVVHVPLDLLLDPGDVAPDDARPRPGTATVAALAVVPMLEPRGARLRHDAARFLVCDAGLHAVVEDGNGDPLHLGRRRTTITAAQRRAVHARDPHCTWPGCTATTVQLHHRHHRVAGGHDDVENLVPLCTWHHGVVHRRSIVVGRAADGALRFVRSDGTTIGSLAPFARTGAVEPPRIDPGSTVEDLRSRQRSLGIDVDAPLRAPQWMNDPFDLGDVIAAILERRDAALRRTVPTGAPTGVPTGVRTGVRTGPPTGVPMPGTDPPVTDTG